MATPLPIADGFYQAESSMVANLRCINWWPANPEAAALSPAVLYGWPGLEQLTTTGEIQQWGRGFHVINGKPYTINGDAVYRIDRSVDIFGVESFTNTSIGSIEGMSFVSTSDNGTQLMILVPGGKGYILTSNYPDSADALVEITDAGFTANGNPETVDFLQGKFYCNTDEKKVISSAIGDGTSWDALDFGSAEADPDPVVNFFTFGNQGFAGGSETIQPYQQTGRSGFALQADQGFIITKGISARFSLVKSSSTFYWIGSGVNESPAIWAYNGSPSPTKVSTTAVDNVIQSATDTEVSDALGFAYAERGAFFVGWSVGSRTLVLNTVTGKWSEVQSPALTEKFGDEARWRANFLVEAFGRVLVNDAIDGRIGWIRKDVFTEYGDNIIRLVQSQPFSNGGESVRVPMIELTCQAGVGNSDTPDPKIRMAWAKDGVTFTDERTRSLGKVGETQRRTIWRRNGRFPRMATLRWVMSDAVEPTVIKAEADVI